MFYSQFILAKKGPLGTIWIAAHLERKLRKNQVADTDIGVSVDSILSPDVPIALRLSSHLLLGVVRIYSRKVNYLFDDCSEALLKVKQAFRSTVVDLPPEESKAPYHSITLPETFDLDDFELPDTEVFLGNFVDPHVSTKEQITLQDTMDGAVYSTSQFGLDERFGDGDASQIALNLDEELLLNKGVSSGHGVLLTSCDPHIPVEPSSSQKGGELELEIHQSESLVEASSCQQGDEPDMEMHEHDSYQPVATDCCTDIDELDVEMHVPSQTVDTEDCTKDFEKPGPQVKSPSDSQPMVQILSSNIADIFGKDEVFEPSKDMNPDFDLNGSLDKSEVNGGSAVEYHVECGEAIEIPNGSVVLGDSSDKPPLSEQDDHHTAKASVNGFCSVPENTNFVDQMSLEPAVDAAACELINNPAPENKEGQDLISPEACEVVNGDAKADMLSVCKPILQPCKFPNNEEHTETDTRPEDSGVASEIDGMQIATTVSVATGQDATNQNLNEDQYHYADHCNNLDLQPVISENIQIQTTTNSTAPELPSPEMMRSLPDVAISQPTELLVGVTPERDTHAQGDHGATMNKISGKKRSFTESTITLQSQNSVESPEAAQSKRSADFVPDDDDLLSSILVGRRSTVLKVKSTPPAFDLVSSKRPRKTPRSSTQKRKVLLDDSMVLHGDTIRQQLVSTEDIRRVRKKAPSTHPEIWILQKQFLEDGMFSEPIFTGMSSKLVSLHIQPFDLREIEMVQEDENIAQSTEKDGTIVPSVARVESGLQSAECLHDLFYSSLENERMTNTEVGPTNLQLDISENRTEVETQFNISENIAEKETQFDVAENRIEMETQFDNSEKRCEIEAQFDISENRTEIETQFDISESRTGMETHLDNSENRAEMEMGSMKEPVENEKDHSMTVGIEALSCVPGASENNPDLVTGDIVRSPCFKDTSDADLSEQVDGSSLNFDDHSSCKDVFVTVDNNVEGLDFGQGLDKAASGDMVEPRAEEVCLEVGLEDADSVVPMAGALPEHSLPLNEETIVAEDRTFDEVTAHEPETANKDDELHKSDLNNDEQREDSKADPSDLAEDVFEHDTDFLNFDDDEMVEDAENDENSIPNAEGPQALDNSGWSTRTRAVANYLQVLFHKEAQHGRTVLNLDNLLAKKSRKEASRMFFETLVLKTRDYIHVDEEVPYGNISIKPRARLLKSDF